jgi:hypothetical protein
LHPQNPLAEIKCQVVPPVLRDRLQYVNSKLDSRQRDRGLGDIPLLI